MLNLHGETDVGTQKACCTGLPLYLLLCMDKVFLCSKEQNPLDAHRPGATHRCLYLGPLTIQTLERVKTPILYELLNLWYDASAWSETKCILLFHLVFLNSVLFESSL